LKSRGGVFQVRFRKHFEAMKISLLIAILSLLILLILTNQLTFFHAQDMSQVGALPWYGWVATGFLIVPLGLFFIRRSAEQARRLLIKPPPKDLQELQKRIKEAERRRKTYDADGPEYPHPVIIEENCISCNACIEACPHDVLTMRVKSDGKGHVAHVTRGDLCMEDTSCEAVCPTNACLVINTTRKIKKPLAPARDTVSFVTNIGGCHVIGDVSGTPLIKNAIKEGVDVIEHLARELKNAKPEPKAKLDVAIIGIGPAGLSAVLTAKEQNLTFLGIEKETVLATIAGYPLNKYVEFKPDHLQTRSRIKMDVGEQREIILESWVKTLSEHGIGINRNDPQQEFDTETINVVHENEECLEIKRAEDGDYFIINTSLHPENKKGATYLARRVVLALGRLSARVPLTGPNNKPLDDKGMEITRDDKTGRKVKYKLPDPREFKGRKLIVVGGGNSAIETAVNLVARRKGNQIEFLPDDEINDVTMLIRTDFTTDVKFLNKQQLYLCKDAGKIKIRFNTIIKEIHDEKVIVLNTQTNKQDPLPNDYIFAMIGGAAPIKFLKSNGIHVPEPEKS
jgi:thioredoxin reductase/NAD-dependent dihydropyrimidine dehydrogenase PreA subunit